jgi:lysylphosphatidylglycerol synthetase-like protein (DUF2156 family)
MDAAFWRGRASFGFTVAAVLYSLALLAWVVLVPSTEGETLLEYGGLWSLAITAQPLLVSLIMWRLLRNRCTTGSRAAATAAWTIGGMYLGWSVIGALSLAAGAFPAALLLLIAVTLTPDPRDSRDDCRVAAHIGP